MFQGPSRDYHQVPQNSDSDEDEVTLYAAPESMNRSAEHTTFGKGVYNRDLRLDLTSPGYNQSKADVKLRENRRLLYSALCCLLVVLLVVGLALTIIVYAQAYLPGVVVNTNSTEGDNALEIDPECKLSPLPLSGKTNGCKNQKPVADPHGMPPDKGPPGMPSDKGPPGMPPDKGPPHSLNTGNTHPLNIPNNDNSNSPVDGVPRTYSATGVDWTRSFSPGRTELSLQYVDANRDGTPDVIASVVNDMCSARLVALDGLTGATVWEAVINFELFSLRCVIDVDQDGVMDCIASGRDGGFTAVNGADGAVLWVVDTRISYPSYNFLFPLVVGDLDSDGVPDLVNTHGGGMDYEPDDKDRLPGFLVVISGRTGAKLMDPILMPDGHETYCSPLLYKFAGTELILFGTGGETISGSLWAITLDSIKLNILKNRYQDTEVSIEKEDTFHPCFMNKDFIQSLAPVYNSSYFDESFTRNKLFFKKCPKISNKELIWNAYDLCLYELFDSPDKGVMVPPVVLDLNADSVDDLLLQTFTGKIIAWDGRDLSTVLWQREFEGTESYSIPSPLFYNEDRFPDLLIRSDVGVWDQQYSASNIYILDGGTGATLWSHHSDHSVMNSGISVASDNRGGDALIFYSVDKLFSSGQERGKRDNKPPDSFVGPQLDDLWVSAADDQFPDPDQDLSGFLEYCSDVTDISSVSLYFLTREMIESGLEIKPLAIEMPIVLKDLGEIGAPSKIARRHADQYSRSAASSLEGGLGEAPEDVSRNGKVPNNPFKSGNQPPGSGGEDFTNSFPDNFDPSQKNPNNFDPSKMDPNNFDPNKMDPDHFDPNQDYSNSDYDHPPGLDGVDMNDKKAVRCSLAISPTNAVPTPVIGDLNGDGKLELTYAFVRQTDPQHMIFLGMPTDTLSIRTFTIEDRFAQVYSRDAVVDFSHFVAADNQPWGKFMGRTGDNVFRPNHIRDT